MNAKAKTCTLKGSARTCVCGISQEAGRVASAKPALVRGRADSECARGRDHNTAPCADLIRSVCDISPAHLTRVPDRYPYGAKTQGLVRTSA